MSSISHNKLTPRVWFDIEKTSNTNYSAEAVKKNTEEDQETAIREIFQYENSCIRSNYERNGKIHFGPHIYNSREMMLSGADSLNKRSRVIVMAPGLLEPLSDLAARCGELILLNNDETSLQQISAEIGMKNVFIKKMDFSNGLYVEIERVITSATRLQWSCKQFMDKITHLFTKYRPAELLEDDCLKDADLVVSSLVATQFTVIAETRVQEFINMRFNKTLKTYFSERPVEDINRYGVAEHGLSDRLIVQYSKSLAKMIKPNGMIYLSDSVALTTLEPRIDHPEALRVQTMDPANLIEIEKAYAVIQSKKWHWLYMPSSGRGYEVQAYLLKKKQS